MALAKFPSEFDRQVARLEARARYAPRVHSRPAEKLAPLRRLLGRLGHPERGPRVVHLAGTNGKGTTAAMVGRLLQRQGARVGLYTSPHLVDIRERIRIQGEPVSREAFARAAAAVPSKREIARRIAGKRRWRLARDRAATLSHESSNFAAHSEGLKTEAGA